MEGSACRQIIFPPSACCDLGYLSNSRTELEIKRPEQQAAPHGSFYLK